jgi:hypothetical protein
MAGDDDVRRLALALPWRAVIDSWMASGTPLAVPISRTGHVLPGRGPCRGCADGTAQAALTVTRRRAARVR